jgi:saccharopine dehydrogenase (NAD+, L-lysine-forming)
VKARAGIRREDKNEWERRAPLTPEDLKELHQKHGIEFVVQPSPIRVFTDAQYASAGARVSEDLSGCPVVFAIKEIPVEFLQPGTTYVFFSHVIKGQPYNMPMLRKLMELGCNLIDYEKVTNEKGRRLIFFGRHAGLAGAVETLHALGRRLEYEGIRTPLLHIEPPHRYPDLAEIEASLKKAGEEIRKHGLPEQLAPLVVGIAGYGNVGAGAAEIIDMLAPESITPSELPKMGGRTGAKRDVVYKVVFREQDTVEPAQPGASFSLEDFFRNPGSYRSRFEEYLPHLTVLMNAIYWQAGNPRLVTKGALQKLFSGPRRPRLRVIGDISCDIEGAIEATVKHTEPGTPCYTYNSIDGTIRDGCGSQGVVIMAVDNLPCEIPSESSRDFSRILRGFVASIAGADYRMELDRLSLAPELKRALILHRGQLTPGYRYLEEYVAQA